MDLNTNHMSNSSISIVGKRYDKLHEVANMPHELNDILSNPKDNQLSIKGVRFIMILLANLKDRQIPERNRSQLTLFDSQAFSIDNEDNFSIALSFHYSDFLPKGNKNYYQVKEGIEELRNLNYVSKVELGKNSKTDKPIRTVKFNSSLILSYIEEENKGFKILLDKYWYRLLINITEGFNPYIKSIAFNIKSLNSLQFYFYLKKLPEIKQTKMVDYQDLYDKLGNAAVKYHGTITYVDNLIETLNLRYKFESELSRDYLDPIRAELDKFADISFNYKYHDSKIYIISYPVTKTLISTGISKAATSQIKSALNYKTEKYNLSAQNAIYVIELYLKYGYELVTKATNKKKILVNKKGEEYFAAFNALVELYFKKSGKKIEEVGYSPEDKNEIRKELRKKLVTDTQSA
jgi:hypothetical protein